MHGSLRFCSLRGLLVAAKVPQLSQLQFSGKQQFQGVEDNLGALGQVKLRFAMAYGWTQ